MFFCVKKGSPKMFSVPRRSWAHPASARLTLLDPQLWHTGRGGYPVVRCEFVGNNKQWSRGQPGYWRAQVGPYGYLTPAPSTITLLLLLLLLFLFLHFYWLTTSLLRGQNRDLEPFLLEPAVVLQELLIISQLWYDLWRTFLYLHVYML